MQDHIIEKLVIYGARYLTIIAVIGSLAGSVLMFVLGMSNIIGAYRYWLPPYATDPERLSLEAAAVISVIEALDRFLIAIVLLYFGYGVYTLFIRPNDHSASRALPSWFDVKSIGQLKQVVAEVIIVVLFVLFLRVALGVFRQPNVSLTWPQIATFATLPLSTVLLALSLRLAELHPKPSRRTTSRRETDLDEPS